MAKVVSVFERSANVVLVWSPKREISDLKIKATLRLVASKRYDSNSSRYSRGCSRESLYEKSIDVSELIYVELATFDCTSRVLELVRCDSLEATEEGFNAEDEEGISAQRFQSKSATDCSFHDYMIDHCDLRNPALVKQQMFTTILHRDMIVSCRKEKKKSPPQVPPPPSVFPEAAQTNHRSAERKDDPTHTESNHQRPKRRRSTESKQGRDSSTVTLTDDGEDSSVLTASSSRSSSYRRKRHRKHKSHHHHHRHKRERKKHRKRKSKKSKKSKKHRKQAAPSSSSSSGKHSKHLDDKILKWLNQI